MQRVFGARLTYPVPAADSGPRKDTSKNKSMEIGKFKIRMLDRPFVHTIYIPNCLCNICQRDIFKESDK